MSIIKNPTTVIKSGGGEDKLAYRISDLRNYTYENNEIVNMKINAFRSDTNLVEIRCNNVLSIQQYTFQGCSSLILANFPSVTSMGNNAFENCINLTSVSFPSATTITNNVFQNCTALASISFPVLTSIGNTAFSYCTHLVSVSFPAVRTIGDSAFNTCANLISISFTSATRIGNSVFYNCSSLTSITLGNTSQVCTLSNTGAIPATSSHHVNIYVPVNLVASYRTATNWSTLYNNGYISFLPIDGQLINTSITNGTFSGPVAIANNGTATITITANSGYELPTSVSVTGASYTYSNGVITLSNPTAEVNISATCPQATPSGYNLEITSSYSVGSDGDSNVYVKLNGYASRAYDYDYYIKGTGLYPRPSNIYNKKEVLQSNPLNLTQISSIQIWGDSSCYYDLNNSGDSTEVSGGFNNRVMLTISQNSTIELVPEIED